MLMLEPSSEATEFASDVRRMLRKSWPLSATRVAIDDGAGCDAGAWKALADLGVAGLLVPDKFGGADAGLATAVLVAAEIGRVLLPGPFWSSSVLAATTLVHLDTEPARELQPGIADGSVVATVAVLDGEPGSYDRTTVDAELVGDTWSLTGVSDFVTDAASATVVLVAARTADGPALFSVPAGEVAIRPLVTIDPTRPLSRLTYAGTAATLLGVGASVTAALQRAEATAAVMMLAEAVGGAERCLELATDYARTRVQFGHVIGSYQAIKHRCADMFIRLESVRSAVHHAAAVVEDDASSAEDVQTAVDTALAFSLPRLLQNAGDTIQVHGGIGFTWEHDAHFYFKRAQADAQLLGSAAQRRTRLAHRLGVLAPAG